MIRCKRIKSSILLKLLLAAGPHYVNIYGPEGVTPLTMVLNLKWLDVAHYLITEKGALINAVDKQGMTALMHMAQQGNKEAVEFLIAHDANIDQQDNEGVTALMYAAEENHPEIVRLLLNAGADVFLTNKEGETAEYLAPADSQALEAVLLAVKKQEHERHVRELAREKYRVAQLQEIRQRMQAAAKEREQKRAGSA